MPVIRLKDEKGHFKKEAIVCVMALVVRVKYPQRGVGRSYRQLSDMSVVEGFQRPAITTLHTPPH